MPPPTYLTNLLSRDLLHLPYHPLTLLKTAIVNLFPTFAHFHQFDTNIPITFEFDALLRDPAHPYRSPNYSYYLDPLTVLRSHLNTYVALLANDGNTNFLVSGNVFRQPNCLNKTHFPIFHQLDIFASSSHPAVDALDVLQLLFSRLFGQKRRFRFSQISSDQEQHLPFLTNPIIVEVELAAHHYLEVAQAGSLHPRMLDHLDVDGKAYSISIGLDRLAMCLFNIPDIRLFWSEDRRFLSQFREGHFRSFIPFVPRQEHVQFRDLSFYSTEAFNRRKMFDLMRDEAWTILDEVFLLNQEGKRLSYRMVYRDPHRLLSDKEVDVANAAIVQRLGKEMDLNIVAACGEAA